MFPFSFLSSFSAGRKWESHPPRWKSFSWSVRTYFHQPPPPPPPSPCTQPPPPSQPPTTSYERARARDNSRPCLFWWPLFSFFRTHFSFLNYKLEPNYGLRPPCPPPWRPPFYSNPQLTVSFCASFSFASFLFGPRLVAAPYSWPSTETV